MLLHARFVGSRVYVVTLHDQKWWELRDSLRIFHSDDREEGREEEPGLFYALFCSELKDTVSFSGSKISLIWFFDFWQKNTTKEIRKTSKPQNWTNISANLSLVWSEMTAKTLNLQVLEVCFQVFLKECKYSVSVIAKVTFERTRKCVKAKNKQL